MTRSVARSLCDCRASCICRVALYYETAQSYCTSIRRFVSCRWTRSVCVKSLMSTVCRHVLINIHQVWRRLIMSVHGLLASVYIRECNCRCSWYVNRRIPSRFAAIDWRPLQASFRRRTFADIVVWYSDCQISLLYACRQLCRCLLFYHWRTAV